MHPRIPAARPEADQQEQREQYPDPKLQQHDIVEAQQQLLELLKFMSKTFPETHPFSQIAISPDMPGAPEIWLLGSSGWSADAAAHLSLPYAAAHFINPQTTRQAMEH